MTRVIIGGLDTETTGIDQEKGHRLIEVALSLYDLADRSSLGSWVTRLNPQRSIDPKAEAVHGISFDDLVDKPVFESVAANFSTLMGKCDYIVAHNGEGFDMPFIFREFLRVGVPPPTVRLVDTMLQGRWATPDGSIPNLGALCFAAGVEYDKAKAHGALYDVQVMMDSFFAQFDRGFFHLPSEPFVLKPTKEKK